MKSFVFKCVVLLYLMERTSQSEGSLLHYVVDIGKPVILPCTTFANLTNRYTAVHWTKDGTTLNTSSICSGNASLILSKVSEDDSGNYSCIATRPSGVRRSEIFLEILNIPNTPAITEFECNGFVSEIRWTVWSNPRVPIIGQRLQQRTTFTGDTWETLYSFPASLNEMQVYMNPWSNYTFRLVAWNRIGESQPSALSARCETPPDVPFKNPSNVLGFGTDPNNLIISWQVMPPDEHNGPDFCYQISYRLDQYGVNWTDSITIPDWTESWYEVTDQDTFQRYRIKVEAFNRLGGARMKVNEVIGFSGEDVPSEPPSNLTLVRVLNATTAEIKWNAILQYTLNGHFGGVKIQSWLPSEDPSYSREMMLSENATQCLVNILLPFETNLVQIAVRNGQYESDPSNVITITTPEGVPGPVELLKCRKVESNSLKISWEEPFKPNGILTGYKVVWKKISNNPDEETECSKFISGTLLTTTTVDIAQNVSYRVTVGAMTSVGMGTTSTVDCNTGSVR